MRVAILVSGPPRFNKDFNNFINNIYGFETADWFFYLGNNNIPPDKSVNFKLDTNYKTIHIADCWRYNKDTEWAKNKILSKLPSNHKLAGLTLYDAEEVIIPNHPAVSKPCWRMHHHWKQVDLMRQAEEEKYGKYDLVIRTRPDLGIDRPLDLRLFKDTGFVDVPKDNWHGYGFTICDLASIGSSDHMSVYCDLFNRSLEYTNKGVVYHNETLLAYHLQFNNIPYRASGWNYLIWTSRYIRNDGVETYDFGGWD